MYALVFLLFNLIITTVYFFTKEQYSNMKSFLDAFYYSLSVSTTVGYGDIVPKTKAAKITTMVHALLVFFSVSKLIFQSQGSFFVIAIVNGLLLGLMSYIYKRLDSNLGKTNVDYAYFATITHTTVGFGDHPQPLSDNMKLAVIAHILLVFLLLNSYNGGIFSFVNNLLKPRY